MLGGAKGRQRTITFSVFRRVGGQKSRLFMPLIKHLWKSYTHFKIA